MARCRRRSPSWTASSGSGFRATISSGWRRPAARRPRPRGATSRRCWSSGEMAGHHRCDDHACGGAGGHPGVRDRRHRRGASRRGVDLRYLRRPRGTEPNAGGGGLRRGQVDPRYCQDARGAGDQWRAGAGLSAPTSSRPSGRATAATRSTTGSMAPRSAARIIALQFELGLGGVLIANPIPEQRCA